MNRTLTIEDSLLDAKRSMMFGIGRSALLCLVCACVIANVAGASFASSAWGALSVVPAGQPDGFVAETADTQAGAHPDAVSNFNITPTPTLATLGLLKDTIVDLPVGLVGNPEAAAKCTQEELVPSDSTSSSVSVCPPDSQIGVVELHGGLAPGVVITFATVPLFNMSSPFGSPADFGFIVLPSITPVHLTASLRPDDYGVRLAARNAPQTPLPIAGTTVRVWGVPADAVHDGLRIPCLTSAGFPDGNACPSAATQRAFLTNPTVCDEPKRTLISVSGWAEPNNMSVPEVALAPTPTGCEKVPFEPNISVQPTSSAPDSPTGLDFQLSMPQDGLISPSGVASAHLKRARVVLPEGMTINPSSADGLASCSDGDLRLSTNLGLNPGEPICPEAAKIGSVTLETPLLPTPVSGGVYVRSQNSSDPASGEMFRIAIVVRDVERGIMLKLPGRVTANPDTGRIETTFDNNPQLPFTKLELHLKAGPRAPLANPPTCGDKTVATELSSWTGHTVSTTNTFTIRCPGLTGFAPAFTAGLGDRQWPAGVTGGSFAPLHARIDRGDGTEYVDGINVQLPDGLLARVRGVPLCGDAAAAAGTCPAASRVGSATVGAGVGTSPFFLTGQVFLTESYKGAPYGLSIAVPAKAGPFDLGMVVVRQALAVDPDSARVTALSDPVPTIVKGVPVRLRTIQVDVDRPEFALAPTSCAEKGIAATLHSQQGSSKTVVARFQAADCASLAVRPHLSMRLTGSKQTTDGKHPGLDVLLTQPAGQANLKRISVKLPLSLALDPNNANGLCEFAAGQRADCPASSVIGSATAVSPLLNRPLRGNVYFVKNVRKDPKTGNLIRTLPTLLMALRGEIAINLRATSTVSKGKLVSTFATIPDAGIKSARIKLKGGKGGILTVTNGKNICKGRQIADVQMDGHNGRRHDPLIRMASPCKRGARAGHR